MVKGWTWWLELTGWCAAGVLLVAAVALSVAPQVAGELPQVGEGLSPGTALAMRFDQMFWAMVVVAVLLGFAMASGYGLLGRYKARHLAAARRVSRWIDALVPAAALALAAVVGARLPGGMFLPLEVEIPQYGSPALHFVLSVLGAVTMAALLVVAAAVLALGIWGFRLWLRAREVQTIRLALNH